MKIIGEGGEKGAVDGGGNRGGTKVKVMGLPNVYTVPFGFDHT